MSYVVEVPLGQSSVKIIVNEYENGLVRAARPGEVVARAKRSLEEMLDGLRPVAEGFVNKLSSVNVPPNEIAVEVGVTFSAEADVIIASTSTEANFGVTLTWKRGDD